MPKLGMAPGATEGTSADISSRGKNPECCSQSSQPEREIACAICLAEAKSLSEGLLECGHKFCFMCIFTWTTQTAAKEPGCPLCKASCDFITKQEVDSAGKLDETMVDLCKKEMGSSSARIQRTIVPGAVCIPCGNSDAEELLMRCETCGNRVIHTFCMNPLTRPPWCCPGCTQSIQRTPLDAAPTFLPIAAVKYVGSRQNESNVIARQKPLTTSYPPRKTPGAQGLIECRLGKENLAFTLEL